jgi:glycosyl hydrolase family 16
MKNIKKYIGLAAAALPLAASAQLNIGFETTEAYTQLGVYDAWEESPFRKGLLQGNVKVITNELTQEDEILGIAPNATDKMLAVQCSRFGSNTFGARIDLAEPFELTTTAKYVHVFVNKPTAGRVMLIGLGKRTDRAGQSPETEQFWEVSTSTSVPNKWSDAVFAIKGNGGIEIHSLVVVPECESPHNLSEDFAAYIDEITFMDTATPRVIYGDYPLNYPEDQVSSKSGNYLNEITLWHNNAGQCISIGSETPQTIYRDRLFASFSAKPGDVLRPSFYFSANWMNGYVYLDRGNDGKFSYELNDDYTIPEGSDIMSYSYVETVENTEGYKSDGTKVSGNARNFINPPSFTVPDLPYGFYRMRFKVDWGSVDPAGRNTSTNNIVQNGGMIVDTRMNIHGDEVTISRAAGLNGDLLDADGNELRTVTAKFGEPFTIIARPASDNFKISHIRVRHGYNLDGDSLVHGTPQYTDHIFPAYLFHDNRFTIPSYYIDGDVLIEPFFIDPGEVETPSEDYPRNFSDDLTVTRTDRKLNSFTFTATQGGSSTITLPEGTNLVYRDLTAGKQVSVVPGDVVTTAVNYTGRAMHHYLYIDLDQDGQFTGMLNSNGLPSYASELVSYTCYNNHNSLGETIETPGSVAVDALPAFTIPNLLPIGVYRARLKIDWNNIDPAGKWAEGENNNIDDNGGYVVDFLLNVHYPIHPLTLLTENGSINGTNYSALPRAVSPFQALSVVPTPAVTGFTAEKMTVKHGHNFDGPQYIHGNRQWNEYEVDATSCTLPADSIDGDVILSVNFVEGEDATYELVFSDEFNAPDGTRPDPEKWTCSPRQGATWNRWIADDERVAFLQGGQLVTRAIPNPDTGKYSGEMITGAVQSSGGRFGFKYGKIEGRILTNPHTGNFPAFWMMPDDQKDGWPACGEIDIWEQIDNQQTAYHTLHTGYRTSMYAVSENCPTDRYHTFGFEWDAEKMIWYLDGKQVGRYNKSSNSDPRSWPFDKSFYIILNQSVGSGAWAANADVNHTYETRFDWVRVYQLKENGNAIKETTAGANLDIQVNDRTIVLTTTGATTVHVCNIAGQSLFSGVVEGQQSISVPQGIYLVNNRKVMVP